MKLRLLDDFENYEHETGKNETESGPFLIVIRKILTWSLPARAPKKVFFALSQSGWVIVIVK